MTGKETLNEKVYKPIKDLKQKMYDSKDQQEWDNCKEELKVLFNTAQSMMDKNFYEKYKQGIVDSISKMYTFKEKQFNKKQFIAQPKQSYIFREGAESEAFVRLCNAISAYLEKKI